MSESNPVTIKPFDELTVRELHACFRLRGEVFVVGQKICDLPDVDELDPLCHHAMLWVGEELAGTARLLVSHRDHAGLNVLGTGRGPHFVKVGRVAVAKAYRGRGFGVALMRGVQGWIGNSPETQPPRVGVMSAQAYLERWYTALGWERVGEVYEEAGIEHLEMRWGGRE